jgi:hypothetical protein
MERNVLNDEEEKLKYLNSMFKEEGYNTLNSALRDLIKEYFTRKEEEYPVSFRHLGLPSFKFSNIYSSKEDLFRQIKALMQILATNIVEVEMNGVIKVVSFKEE